MNKNTVIIIFIIIILVFIGLLLWGASDKSTNQTVDFKTLDQNTKDDSTTQVEANLNVVNTDDDQEYDKPKSFEDIKSL